jgi:hypothetical protein
MAQYQTRFITHNTPTTAPVGQTQTVSLTVQNAGDLTWTATGSQAFRLGFAWYSAAGQPVQSPTDHQYYTSLPADVPPGSSVSLQARLRTPDSPGTYQLRWDMIHGAITWFSAQGDQGLVVRPITITAPQPARPIAVSIQDVSASLPKHPTLPPYPRRTVPISRIILHHTVTPDTLSVERLAQIYVTRQGRELPGIPAHYYINGQGQIFQTQPLDVASAHAGNFSQESIGVSLIGNFTDTPPTQAQLNATAALLAKLLAEQGLSTEAVFGYRDLEQTASPGDTWPQWKGPLLDQVRSLMAGGGVTPAPTPTTPTSGGPPPYKVAFISHNTPPSAPAGQTLSVNLALQNQGSATWTRAGNQPFDLGFQWRDGAGRQIQLPSTLDFRTSLPNDVPPNQTVSLTASLRTPDQPGTYTLLWDMVHEQVTWFHQAGSQPLTLSMQVTGGQPGTGTISTGKAIGHYLLLWYASDTQWDYFTLWGAADYIGRFKVTVGFSEAEAKLAQYVTLVGDKIPATVEQNLRAAGCQVGRITGNDPFEIDRKLTELAAQNRRF